MPNEARPNNNWVPAGHNLMPDFFTKQFYYAHSPAGTAAAPQYDKWTPSYLSYALAALFQDPDVPGLIISI